MFQRLFALLVCVLYASSLQASSITVTPTLDPIFQAAEQADKDTLFIFDVDDVLVIPSDTTLLSQNQKEVEIYEHQYRNQYSEKHCHHLWSMARKALNVRLVDPKILHVLQLLHQKHIKAMGLTNAGTGRFGTIQHLEDFRIQELKRLGIDFRSAFAIKKYIKFYALQSQADQKRLPMFKDGILFTCNVPKGKVLEAFLKHINWKPKKIIFIDDKLKHVESVQHYCEKAQLPFQGFQYTGASHIQHTLFQKKRADLQFKILAKEQRWLNDAEADALLSQQDIA